MLAFTRKSPDHHAATDRVRKWTRERFGLSDDATILVLELACAVPGCPPVDTVVAFWTERGRHQFKMFKPATDVALGDLPPAWMKNAIVASDELDLDCC